ncbi:hypothetical protein V6N13_130125 [Hibiscus sabdariffa]
MLNHENPTPLYDRRLPNIGIEAFGLCTSPPTFVIVGKLFWVVFFFFWLCLCGDLLSTTAMVIVCATFALDLLSSLRRILASLTTKGKTLVVGSTEQPNRVGHYLLGPLVHPMA